MKKILFLFTVLISTTYLSIASNPKYIFLFIGDGMGFNHIALTESTLYSGCNSNGFSTLGFTRFPSSGFVMTNAQNRLITCSAAAGTAIACGEKTTIGTIGMNGDHTINLMSIANKAKLKGMKVGLITSVSIDHATPASFYAHAPKRDMYHQIASWMPKAGFDIYAGSGMLKPIEGDENIYKSLIASGYSIHRGSGSKLTGDKVYWEQAEGLLADNIPLAIDYKDGDLSLVEMTSKSVEFLNNDNGFFIMIEGGQIDWAAHSNDAASIVMETKDLDNAVNVAMQFYHNHPNETLIIVTADHETGGLALGLSNKGYDTDFSLLKNQKISKGNLAQILKRANQWSDVKKILQDKLGFWQSVEILSYEENMLIETYKTNSENIASVAINTLMSKAGVGFTTNVHTAAYVPIFSIGSGSELFSGRLDNSDVSRHIVKIID